MDGADHPMLQVVEVVIYSHQVCLALLLILHVGEMNSGDLDLTESLGQGSHSHCPKVPLLWSCCWYGARFFGIGNWLIVNIIRVVSLTTYLVPEPAKGAE